MVGGPVVKLDHEIPLRDHGGNEINRCQDAQAQAEYPGVFVCGQRGQHQHAALEINQEYEVA